MTESGAQAPLALLLTTRSGPGVLHEVTGIIARHGGDITSVMLLDADGEWTKLSLEIRTDQPEETARDLRASPSVTTVDRVQTLQRVFG